VPGAKFLSNTVFESSRKLPGFLSQAPRQLPAGAAFISILHWLRMLHQGSWCVPAAKFTVDHASMSF